MLPVLLAGCAEPLPEGRGVSGSVVVDGSSTLTPLVQAGVAEFTAEVEPGVSVDLTTSGTGAGVQRLCAGEADLAMASRGMTEEEVAACTASGVESVEIPVGLDAISLVVPRRNDYVDCLSTGELARIWSTPGTGEPVRSWAEVREGLPDITLALFEPGASSGTSDYFDEVVLEGAEPRTDVATSEDDDVIAQGVATNPGGFGYVPLTYAEQRSETLRTVAVDAGDGCVEPTVGAAADGSYAPLTRPLYLYVAADAYRQRPAVAAFVDYLVERAAPLAEQVAGVPGGQADAATARQRLAGLQEQAP